MATEKEILAQLQREELNLSPLTFKLAENDSSEADAVYDISWEGNNGYRFVAEVKARATSQTLAAAAAQAKSTAYDLPGSKPLVIVPYLSPTSIAEVEQLGISAVDLCGNGIVQVPPQWLVVRSGNPNRFRSSEPLRSAYSGVASLVARAFAVNPRFDRVSDIRDFITSRDGQISLATVSKALRQLEEDLVVARKSGEIAVLQRDKILSKLRSGYKPPKTIAKLRGKARATDSQIRQELIDAATKIGAQLCLTGLSSSRYQTVLAAEPISAFYCSCGPQELLAKAGFEFSSDPHFPNLELVQTTDPRVYFDRRQEGDVVLTSPIQTWLELAVGDKRTREVAEALKERLLAEVA
ncbi:MAG: hypothetical protein Tsb0020_11690 [Haliangiales bacterium]